MMMMMMMMTMTTKKRHSNVLKKRSGKMRLQSVGEHVERQQCTVAAAEHSMQ